MTDTTILTEEMKENLGQTLAGLHTPEMQALIKTCYEFAEIYTLRGNVKPEQREEFERKFEDAQELLFKKFEQVAKAQGLDFAPLAPLLAQFKEQLASPSLSSVEKIAAIRSKAPKTSSKKLRQNKGLKL